MKDFLVLGLGNPLLCDDGAGPLAAQLAAETLPGFAESVDFRENYCGGYDLLHELSGYRKAVMVDCMMTGRFSPGACRLFEPSAFSDSRQNSPLFSHGVTLDSVFSLASRCGYPMPVEYRIIGIEASDCATFSETVTPAVEAGVREAVKMIRDMLTRWIRESQPSPEFKEV